MEIEADGAQEKSKGKANIGTTQKGIGPTYAAKSLRIGLRVGDLVTDWDGFKTKYDTYMDHAERHFGVTHIDRTEEIDQFNVIRERLVNNNMVTDTVRYMNQALKDDKRILAEGANALMLDIDHGTYPYVTSSSTSVGGVCTGLGVPPQVVETTIGVMKAYTTRVGEGPFPTELTDDIGEHMQTVGREFGVTTGRMRRCGWLDLNVVKYAHSINGLTSFNLTKLDCLSGLKELKIGTHYELDGRKLDGEMPSTLAELERCKVQYITVPGFSEDISNIQRFEDLPTNALDYIKTIEEILNVPVSWVGTGPDREDVVRKLD